MKRLFGDDAKEVIRNGLEFSASQWRFAQFDIATIQFLKARCLPLYQVHYVSVQETAGQRWRFTFLLAQKEGLWCVKTSGGGPEGVLNEPQELHDCPWIRLDSPTEHVRRNLAGLLHRPGLAPQYTSWWQTLAAAASFFPWPGVPLSRATPQHSCSHVVP